MKIITEERFITFLKGLVFLLPAVIIGMEKDLGTVVSLYLLAPLLIGFIYCIGRLIELLLDRFCM